MKGLISMELECPKVEILLPLLVKTMKLRKIENVNSLAEFIF